VVAQKAQSRWLCRGNHLEEFADQPEDLGRSGVALGAGGDHPELLLAPDDFDHKHALPLGLDLLDPPLDLGSLHQIPLRAQKWPKSWESDDLTKLYV
jgi:hypothetical protein